MSTKTKGRWDDAKSNWDKVKDFARRHWGVQSEGEGEEVPNKKGKRV